MAKTISDFEGKIIHDLEFSEVRQNSAARINGLFTKVSFKPGDVISEFSAGLILKEPTYLTLQIGICKHITLIPEFLQYVNHSCDPNVFFDTSAMKVVAQKRIEADEELTFFYPSTEWIMIQPFKCLCGSPKCLGEIRGAFYLSEEEYSHYKLTDFIIDQLRKKDSGVS